MNRVTRRKRISHLGRDPRMNTLTRGVIRAGAVALGLATLGWSERAQAAGFATQHFGGEQGTVVATNPTAVYYNPGALGFSGGGALGLYGQLAVRTESWTRQAAPGDLMTTPDSQIGNYGTASLVNV